MYWYGLFFVVLAVALVVVATHAMRARTKETMLDRDKQYRYSKGETTAFVFGGFVLFMVVGVFLMGW
ncbi:MAG: hypothetical protein NZ807_10510 [Dehalococcoidia bacterium]|jgi:hypothetical protein|nr:hypothetical protein [Dehalococcoidia bacterium]|tara:strand:- start:139 stop:339 length:201 start_codon:yes stop_codon:yes gene_type:complete